MAKKPKPWKYKYAVTATYTTITHEVYGEIPNLTYNFSTSEEHVVFFPTLPDVQEGDPAFLYSKKKIDGLEELAKGKFEVGD